MRTLVLGDLHLSSHTPKGVERDLERVLDAHGGSRVIFAGDFFDLSAEAGKRARFGVGVRSSSGRARGALRGTSSAAARSCSSRATTIRRSRSRRPRSFARGVRVSPWFFREGGLHVEHGHLYDPDNAPAHPLASARGTLGVHFVEEFIAKTGAFAYLNANDKTPLELFASAFRWYGRRGPFVVYTYFRGGLRSAREERPLLDGDPTPHAPRRSRRSSPTRASTKRTARALMDGARHADDDVAHATRSRASISIASPRRSPSSRASARSRSDVASSRPSSAPPDSPASRGAGPRTRSLRRQRSPRVSTRPPIACVARWAPISSSSVTPTRSPTATATRTPLRLRSHAAFRADRFWKSRTAARSVAS